MQDEIDALHGARGDREVGDIAFEKLDARQMGEVLAMAGDQAVGDTNPFAATYELFCKVGPDEARATSDQV